MYIYVYIDMYVNILTPWPLLHLDSLLITRKKWVVWLDFCTTWCSYVYVCIYIYIYIYIHEHIFTYVYIYVYIHIYLNTNMYHVYVYVTVRTPWALWRLDSWLTSRKKWVVTHSYVCHDSFICVTWLIHMCDVTRSYVLHGSFICLTWLIHMSRVTFFCTTLCGYVFMCIYISIYV